MASKRRGPPDPGSGTEVGGGPRSARTAVLEEGEGAGTTLDVDALRQIVEILEQSDITRLSWRRGRERLLIRRGVPATVVQASPAGPAVTPVVAEAKPAHQEAQAPDGTPLSGSREHLVTSPFVGTFYRSPAPGQPPFVELGSLVQKGQMICIVEAMKLMNEIEADLEGRISEIMVEDGQPVEYGQALFRIQP